MGWSGGRGGGRRGGVYVSNLLPHCHRGENESVRKEAKRKSRGGGEKMVFSR